MRGNDALSSRAPGRVGKHGGRIDMFATNRRTMLRITGMTAMAAAMWTMTSAAEAQDKLRIGYAISKTGPYAGGASITTLPNYELWVKDVNAAGGIKIGDKKVPIEIVEYDDRS